MGLSDLSSKDAIIQAIKEYDVLGESAFFEQCGFSVVKESFLEFYNNHYLSKAIRLEKESELNNRCW